MQIEQTEIGTDSVTLLKYFPFFPFDLAIMYAAISLFCLLVYKTVSAQWMSQAGVDNCDGGAPMESVSSYSGMDLNFVYADSICCHNHVFAEVSGAE